jgi:GntR family transcriptional repressor for pyruvate dehydrogenase complex
MTLTSLNAASRTEQVVSQLTQAILSGDIAQGSLLPPERELAERLGVSRNVVREATKILKSRGLLDIRQGIGTIVKSVTSEPVQEMFNNALHGHDDALTQLTEVRLVLEVQIAA